MHEQRKTAVTVSPWAAFLGQQVLLAAGFKKNTDDLQIIFVPDSNEDDNAGLTNGHLWIAKSAPGGGATILLARLPSDERDIPAGSCTARFIPDLDHNVLEETHGTPPRCRVVAGSKMGRAITAHPILADFAAPDSDVAAEMASELTMALVLGPVSR